MKEFERKVRFGETTQKFKTMVEEQLLEQVTKSAKTIMDRISLREMHFSLDEFAFEFRNDEAVLWLEFYGYKEARKSDFELLVVKEVFRFTCNKLGVIFIDNQAE